MAEVNRVLDASIGVKHQYTIKRLAGEHVLDISQVDFDAPKAERLVLDWRKQQRTYASIRVAIFDALEQLPEQFTKDLYGQKCEQVYQHVYESYFGAGQSVYAITG
ncbi:MAG: hypothetical protein CVU44_21560 [Chloroflexi bacterium HGW-Chloroflexi-6]|nr:MAG: hypothetical protein CVU44_21560 [Chloroflexi bacterium HGW-Chloroflexi-6]